MTPGAERFPKAVRLRRRGDYLKVQESGHKLTVGPFVVLVLPNANGVTRLGITVSSKVGNAVMRVRIRRHLREVFRKRYASLPSGLDLVFIARASAAQADGPAIRQAFDTVAQRLKERAP